MFRGRRQWSPLEEEWLKNNQDNLSMTELAKQLGRGVSTVKTKIKENKGIIIPGKKNKISYIGKRKDLGGLFVRSRWEANVLRWLSYQDLRYMYEPQTFFFTELKRGTLSYMPDIYLPDSDEYIEIKGQLTSQGRTAVRRFKKYYPGEFAKLRAITGSPKTHASKFFDSIKVPILAYYNDLNRDFKDKIDGWE